MSSILLISRNNEPVLSLQAMLPAPFEVVHYATLAAGLDNIQHEAPPELVLINAQTNPDDIGPCHQLRVRLANEHQPHIPLVALIADSASRDSALAAGADDYLLLPLFEAEVKSRLAAYLNPAFSSLITLIDTFSQVSSAFLPDSLDPQIERVARRFHAPAAWLMVAFDETFRLVGSYNLPPMFQNSGTLLEETDRCLEPLWQSDRFIPHPAECPYLSPAVQRTTSGIKYHLSVPFVWENRVIGLLKLGYPSLPTLSVAERQRLVQLGQSIGGLLHEFQKHGETQIFATQNALLVMIAQMMSEQKNPEARLALVLEQATPILNAVASEIWLLSKDNAWLTLHSSLSRKAGAPPVSPRPSDAGLLGWAVQHQRLLNANLPTSDPRFASSIDRPPDATLHCILAAPLYHQETTLGVLVMYGEEPNTFSENDAAFLEGIAALTASTLVNARMVQELTDHANQQRILYEMGQQIVSGLDLNVTLDKALYWLQRLSDTETGLLWLIEKSAPDKLQLVASIGADVRADSAVAVAMEQTLAATAIERGQAIMVNDPAHDPNINATVCHHLDLKPKNVLTMPMLYNGQAIGAVCLINKKKGAFDQSDLTLLSTATDMVAIAVGNAQLHTQTVQLIAEREQWHKQMLQTERLATVGRLTASLSHEINNPMQAIQGALTLALEELDRPDEVEAYIQLSLRESARVVTLVNRMRQIYRPQTEAPKTRDVTPLLQEAIAIARKELKRQKVYLQNELASTLPPVRVIANQLNLVFLSFILNFADAIGSAGGGNLTIRTYAQNNNVFVKFLADPSKITPDHWRQIIKPDPSQTNAEISFGLSMSYDIVVAHNGQVNCRQTDTELVCLIELPVSQSSPHESS